jgi:hypothetical protein
MSLNLIFENVKVSILSRLDIERIPWLYIATEKNVKHLSALCRKSVTNGKLFRPPLKASILLRNVAKKKKKAATKLLSNHKEITQTRRKTVEIILY